VGVLAAFLNFKEDWLKQLNFRPAFERLVLTPEQLELLRNPTGAMAEQLDLIHKRLEFVDITTTMSAFAVMVILLLSVGAASRFSKKAAAPVSKGAKS
jgi:hypothetical protein